jgi:hypothetical protein
MSVVCRSLVILDRCAQVDASLGRAGVNNAERKLDGGLEKESKPQRNRKGTTTDLKLKNKEPLVEAHCRLSQKGVQRGMKHEILSSFGSCIELEPPRTRT